MLLLHVYYVIHAGGAVINTSLILILILILSVYIFVKKISIYIKG